MFTSEDALKRKYDAVVVGDNLGSWVSALSLAKKGLRTLFLPQDSKIENAPSLENALLSRFGISGLVVEYPGLDFNRHYQNVPQELALKTLKIGEATLSGYPVKSVNVEVGTDYFTGLASLASAFPTHIKKLRPLFRELLDLCEAYREFWREPEDNLFKLPQELTCKAGHFGLLAANSRKSLASIVREHVSARQINAWLDAFLQFECLMTAEECPALFGALLLAGPAVFGVRGMSSRPEKWADGFVATVRELTTRDLDICPGAEVDEVLIDGQELTGVSLSSKRHLRADLAVIEMDGVSNFADMFRRPSYSNLLPNFYQSGVPTRFRRTSLWEHVQDIPASMSGVLLENHSESLIQGLSRFSHFTFLQEALHGEAIDELPSVPHFPRGITDPTKGFIGPAQRVRVPLRHPVHGDFRLWSLFSVMPPSSALRNVVVLPPRAFYLRSQPWRLAQVDASIEWLLKPQGEREITLFETLMNQLKNLGSDLLPHNDAHV